MDRRKFCIILTIFAVFEAFYVNGASTVSPSKQQSSTVTAAVKRKDAHLDPTTSFTKPTETSFDKTAKENSLDTVRSTGIKNRQNVPTLDELVENMFGSSFITRNEPEKINKVADSSAGTTERVQVQTSAPQSSNTMMNSTSDTTTKQTSNEKSTPTGQPTMSVAAASSVQSNGATTTVTVENASTAAETSYTSIERTISQTIFSTTQTPTAVTQVSNNNLENNISSAAVAEVPASGIQPIVHQSSTAATQSSVAHSSTETSSTSEVNQTDTSSVPSQPSGSITQRTIAQTSTEVVNTSTGQPSVVQIEQSFTAGVTISPAVATDSPKQECEPVSCPNTCLYGRKTDMRGCAVCDCLFSDQCPAIPKVSRLVCMLQVRLETFPCDKDADCLPGNICCPGICRSQCRRAARRSFRTLSINNA